MADIYFIFDSASWAIKIGKAEDVARRIASLQTSSPNPLHLLGVLVGQGNSEQRYHDIFNEYRIRGEWFRPAGELLKFIQTKFKIELRDKEQLRQLLGVCRQLTPSQATRITALAETMIADDATANDKGRPLASKPPVTLNRHDRRPKPYRLTREDQPWDFLSAVDLWIKDGPQAA